MRTESPARSAAAQSAAAVSRAPKFDGRTETPPATRHGRDDPVHDSGLAFRPRAIASRYGHQPRGLKSVRLVWLHTMPLVSVVVCLATLCAIAIWPVTLAVTGTLETTMTGGSVSSSDTLAPTVLAAGAAVSATTPEIRLAVTVLGACHRASVGLKDASVTCVLVAPGANDWPKTAGVRRVRVYRTAPLIDLMRLAMSRHNGT